MDLLIDDTRDLNVDIIARSYESGLAILQSHEVTHLWLDHDLGGDLTGYDLLKEARDFLPLQITLITLNPVGTNNMTQLLREFGYKENCGHFWKD